MEYLNNLYFWVSVIVLLSMLAVALVIAYIYYATKPKPYYDLIDRELEKRNEIELKKLKR